ncbi:hypothetical protein GCM10007103_14670 [Salinimicrobium marinum]|uniref:D-alanyl-D-alanine carboxypeptidase-like core domain-containing protein n=1 Tax=Salinimicrobium marinum TaxID=680283 RepID=A0A918VVS9_9FLAO|nr:D-alanyl-D-alanine carboxypeptidase family protein [Salinimicrobium marinum]GHA34136.1 hypothetical protein GCM10007103_14670 [Salinimicrobium marinum]
MREYEDTLSIPEDLRRFSPFVETWEEGLPATTPNAAEAAVQEHREAGDHLEQVLEGHLHRHEIFNSESRPVTDHPEGSSSTGSSEFEKESFEALHSPSHEGEVELLEEFDNELDFILARELLGEEAFEEEAPASNIYGEKGGGRLALKKDPPPSEIVYIDSFRKIPVHRSTKAAWEAMVSAARAAGHKHPLLLPTSGYRSTAQQTELWKKALRKRGSETKARKWVTKPGGSALHSGRALDLFLGTKNNKESVALQRRTAVYKWLQSHASSFGFYPYSAEPWHWEHNPLPGFRIPEKTTSNEPPAEDASAIPKAVRLNRKYAKETGWINCYSQNKRAPA